MKHTILILVENHAGVLSRVTGLFSRRGYNIDSLAVGVTFDPQISRITIIVEANSYIIEQVEKQLNKLIDVIKVRSFPNEGLISRELVLVKLIKARLDADVYDMVIKASRKRIYDCGDMLVAELCDSVEELEIILAAIPAVAVSEVVRTGVVAVANSDEVLSVD